MTTTESAHNFNLLVRRILHTKAAVAGFIILALLISMTIYAFVAVPLESSGQWNNPGYWIDYPKSAAPSWINSLLPEINLPNHMIFEPIDAIIQNSSFGGIPIISYLYDIEYGAYCSYPTDFIVDYCLKYGDIPPVVQIDVTRPDGKTFMIYNSPLPSSTQSGIASNLTEFCSRVFSY